MNSKKVSQLEDPNKPQLDINQKFIEACVIGDYRTVTTILNSIKDFNIDITDNLGRTALRLAVANENIEIVHALLEKSDNAAIREALLVAIFEGHTYIAETILYHPQYKLFNDKKFVNGATDSFWQPQAENSQFSPDITPIMLAAHYNRTQIVQMLLLNGERIEKPHEFFCKCNECSNRFKFDSLRHAQSRLNAYRGLASESYIALASIDPILTAFEIGFELKILAEKEKYFKGEYLELAEKLSEFTCKLLNNVRGRDELEICLNKTGKENEEKYRRLARLDLALKYTEMPFVAHPNCQQKLVEIWNTGLTKVTKMNNVMTSLLVIGFVFFIPIGSFIYILAPKTKIGKFMCLPYIKFITFTVSYLLFIILIVISSLLNPQDQMNLEKFSKSFDHFYEDYLHYHENENMTYKFQAKDFYIRKSEINVLDIIICVWLFGLYMRELKQIFELGIKDYINAWSNVFTLFMGILYTASYGLKFYTIIRVKMELKNLHDELWWEKLNSLSLNETLDHEYKIGVQKSVYETFYWLNSDRFYWFSLDPMNLSEAVFAVAIIITFARLCFWLPANNNIGPLQITLGRMFSDIVKWICIFLILFGGFIFGLHNLYWYYDTSVRMSVEVVRHFDITKGEEQFGTLFSALLTMFFAIYALGADDDVLIEPFSNTMTPFFGFMLFAGFHIVNITVLLSMLIAMLTTSYEAIQEDADTEWKFARSKLYMEFIKEGSTLPIPLNIIPTPSLAFSLGKTLLRIIKRDNNSDNNEHSHHMRGNPSSELTYQKVLERVAKRFLLHNSREFEEVKESDFDELKQDVQFARREVLNDVKILRENMNRYATVIHHGLSLLGEKYIQNNTNNRDEEDDGIDGHKEKFKQFRSFELLLEQQISFRKKSQSSNQFQLAITSIEENKNEREE